MLANGFKFACGVALFVGLAFLVYRTTCWIASDPGLMDRYLIERGGKTMPKTPMFSPAGIPKTDEGNILHLPGLKPPGSHDCWQTVAGKALHGKCWD